MLACALHATSLWSVSTSVDDSRPFFITIHFVLTVPFTDETWRWVVYGLLALLQMLFSAIMKRTVPMVTGALGAFVVAWKFALEVRDGDGSVMNMPILNYRFI